MNKIIILFFIIFASFPLTANETLKIKIGTYENSPKIFTDGNGEVSGFWADITYYIAKKENWEIEWIHGDWDQCMERLENNEIDMMVDVGVTPERQKRFTFSNETVLLSWTRLYTHKGVNLESLMDLEGKKIAGLKGSFNIDGPEGLKDIINKFGLNSEIIELSNYHKVFEALQKREVYACITNKDFGASHESEYNIERTPIIFQPARLQFAFNKTSEQTPGLIKIIDSNLIQLKENNRSIYYTSMERHLGGVEKIDFFPLWLKVLIIFILGLAITSFIISRFLKYQVNQKTILLRQDIAKREQAEEDLLLSKTRFKTLFNNSPVPIWEEDFTVLAAYLKELQEKGVIDFRAYFDNNPDELFLCVQKVNITDVNQAALDLHQAKSKEELLGRLETVFTEKSFDIFKEELIALAEGRLLFESESEVKTITGEPRYIFLKLIIDKNQKNTVRALIATTDITKRKMTEEELTRHREHLEEIVKERTENLERSRKSLAFLLEDVNEVRFELEEKNKKLEQFNRIFIDREFRIKVLRDRVKALEQLQ